MIDKKRDKVRLVFDKEFVIPFLLIIIVASATAFLTTKAFSIVTEDEKDFECSYSKFNKYSNSTEATYLFGNCYIPVSGSYKSTSKCSGGFMGMFESCREVSEYNKHYQKDICFKLETGELC